MAATPALAIPYPVGTDRVMDGDNAMQAIAERVEALLEQRPRGTVKQATLTADAANGTGAIVALLFSFTTLAGHRYRLSATSHLWCQTAGIFAIHELAMDTVAAQTLTTWVTTANVIVSATPWVDLAPSPGNHSFQLKIACTLGQITAKGAAANPVVLSLEDRGTAVPAAMTAEDVPSETTDNPLMEVSAS